MTIGEYVNSKFRAFGVTEAQLADITLSCGLVPEMEFNRDTAKKVAVAMIDILEELMLAPRQRSINEQGFSVSWDFDNIGRWYLWMCRKYGRKPNDEVGDALGLSRIVDRSNMW